ncbi:MAG: TetR/AcrR family transcriptional regulator [Anaerolineae bacterium]|nr:TetR/AcrR family transcriptional regulator [Anaerolineae bacterium]
MVQQTLHDWTKIQTYILQLEQEGLVTRTFRRLDLERQQAIISAIVDEAIEKGPAAINIKHVAKRAGVSVGALYTYFPNRDGMLDFVVEMSVRFVSDEFNSFRPYFLEPPLREALTLYLTGGVEWGKAQTQMVRFFARAAYHRDSDLSDRLVRPIATIMRETLHDILAQAAARGEIRDDVDLEAAARVIYAAMVAAGDGQLLPYLNAYFQVNDEDMPPERTANALIDLILHGIIKDSPQ